MPYIHAMLLFLIGHGLHPHNACSPLVTAYTHVFHVSGNHFIDFYLRPDVCRQHPPGSS